MGNIYFTSDLEIQVLKAIKEAYDCADVKNDLDRIRWMIQYGTNGQAGYLDWEMRKKYPMIDYMLQVANHFPAQAHSPGYWERHHSISRKIKPGTGLLGDSL